MQQSAGKQPTPSPGQTVFNQAAAEAHAADNSLSSKQSGKDGQDSAAGKELVQRQPAVMQKKQAVIDPPTQTANTASKITA